MVEGGGGGRCDNLNGSELVRGSGVPESESAREACAALEFEVVYISVSCRLRVTLG